MVETKSKRVTVGLAGLMLQASQEMRCGGVSMGFAIANLCLNHIAKRAIELNDAVLLEELETIGYVKTSEKEGDNGNNRKG